MTGAEKKESNQMFPLGIVDRIIELQKEVNLIDEETKEEFIKMFFEQAEWHR